MWQITPYHRAVAAIGLRVCQLDIMLFPTKIEFSGGLVDCILPFKRLVM